MTTEENVDKGKRHLALTVNGTRVESDIEPRMTLAEFLREELGLTGTKVGCNRAECGACTVLLNGNPVYSCTMLAVDAAGKEVLTIEGLGGKGNLHPLQEAFIEHDALQCGYCTPGMILSVKALLDRNPHPTEDDVRNTIDGNLCRCGSYPNIIEATIAASEKLDQKERVK
ncbi:MAG: (2Fe-2S)-binding protein [Deltaproteobacteria bacterium]|nr:MAG: (2Fe-2S)-binding protein [Deltaproteobacteria bacterium]